MGIFGWSYPPGCSSVPGDEETPCAICGKWVDDCICPECPVCGMVGETSCYRYSGIDDTIESDSHHGMYRTTEQIESYNAEYAKLYAEEQAMNALAEEYERQRDEEYL